MAAITTTVEHHRDGTFTIRVYATPGMSPSAAARTGRAAAKRVAPDALKTSVTRARRPETDSWVYIYGFRPRPQWT